MRASMKYTGGRVRAPAVSEWGTSLLWQPLQCSAGHGGRARAARVGLRVKRVTAQGIKAYGRGLSHVEVALPLGS